MVHILQITLVAKLIGNKLVFCNYYTLCSLYLKILLGLYLCTLLNSGGTKGLYCIHQCDQH